MEGLRRCCLFYKQGLIEFTDYCIDMYKNHMDVLMEKWNIHQKYQIYGGVAEMSLLYLWVKTLPEGEFLNLLMDDADHCVFDNSIGLPDGYLEGQYEFNRRLGVKKLYWEDGKPYCYTLDGHQKTGLLCLHFVGVTKIFMEGIYEHQDYAFGARFYTYLLTIRGHLADIKHGNTRFQQRIKIRRAEKAGKASNK